MKREVEKMGSESGKCQEGQKLAREGLHGGETVVRKGFSEEGLFVLRLGAEEP